VERGRLRLVRGGSPPSIALGPFALRVAPPEQPPFEPRVRVLEEDTWRILSAPAEASPRQEHPIRLMTAVYDDEPAAPGSVLVGHRGWLAVVYDLDAEPICREQWVADALAKVLEKARRLDCTSLALPLLGTTHGGIARERGLALLVDALRHADGQPSALRRLWLQAPAAECPVLALALGSEADGWNRGDAEDAERMER
jgi:hypothetical protein